MSDSNHNFFDSKVLGHPAGLFVLFFTEMWERFSYYGMRALLVLFLVSAFGLGGWDWPREHALALYGTYTALVYITPIIGGYIADRFTGYRWAVVIGALVMTLGHASMAIESSHAFLYIGIGLLIIGNGFFKPNMTSIVSHMYKDFPEKKDGAYTIFYMGVNAGAFLGILLCGYLGEKVGWSYGFGLAGIFMLLGMLQFYFTQGIFGDIGKKPNRNDENDGSNKLEFEGDKLNPFTQLDKILIAISSIIGVVWVINDPVSKIGGSNILMFNEIDYSNHFILVGLFVFLGLIISRILRYPKVTRDRMIAIVFFAIMTVVFWMSFEQAGGSMNLFAKDYTNRIMTGSSYNIYVVFNIIITVVPVAIITWVLIRLFIRTWAKYKTACLILGGSFLIIWAIIFWMISRDLSSTTYSATFESIKTNVSADSYGLHPDRKEAFESKMSGNGGFLLGDGESVSIDSIGYNGAFIAHQSSSLKKVSEKEEEQEKFDQEYLSSVLAIENTSNATVYYTERGKVKNAKLSELYFTTVITEGLNYSENENVLKNETTIIDPTVLNVGNDVSLIDINKKGEDFNFLTLDKAKTVREKAIEADSKNPLVPAKVEAIKEKEVEIPATWFLILNSLFIIMFAPMFSKWWESKYNPSANFKYAFGLILLGAGFAALAFGSMSIEPGAKTASVSLIWLVLAYLFHTLGELCLSPVALSYVSKLVPGRMIAMMFGVWYIAVAIGNKLAGLLGSKIDAITEEYSMTTFFMIFFFIPVALGVLSMILNPVIKKLMHGVR